MSVNWRIGCIGLVGVTLAGCGVDYNSPTAVLSPESPGTDDLIRLQVAEFDGIEYDIAWTVDGEPVEDVMMEIDPELTERGQTWEVTITPTDAESGKEYDATVLSVSIVNALPYGIVSLNPSAPRTGQDLAAIPGFTDPDGEAVSYTYAWTQNGTDAGITDPVVGGDRLVKGDTWEVTVVASDQTGAAPAASAAAVVANSPPAVAGARVVPEIVFDDTEVSCEGINFQDADGDAEAYKTLWLVDGFEVSAEATLTGDYFDRGQVISCQLIPTDGEDDGPSVSSEGVEVGNGAPSIGGVAIDGATPNRNAALTFTATDVVDADGDEVEYRIWWLVNGRGVSQEAELDPSLFERGDMVSVSVVPFDGFIEGEGVTSSEVEIVNAPPIIVESNFVADPVYTDSVLDPRVILSDADGDPISLTFTWTVNGSTAGDSGSVLDGNAAFDRGDTVAYEVVPNDGIEDGTAYTSATETVVNKPPSDPEVAISPVPTLPDKDIYCSLPEPSVDADGDTIVYTFTWEKDGATYTGLASDTEYTGDTIPASGTALTEKWACSVQASDGTDKSNVIMDETIVRPEDIMYYVDDKSDLGNAGTSCTGTEGTGYYGYNYYSSGLTWYFDDDYDVQAEEIIFRWRQGYATTSSGYRYLYINGSYITYSNFGIARSTSCDSGRTYGIRITGMSGLWSQGGSNTIELRTPCCSYFNHGVAYDGSVEDDEGNYEYGRLEVYTEDDLE